MTNVSIREAQANLPELVHRLRPGDEVIIIENDKPVARIISAVSPPQRPSRQLGTLWGHSPLHGPRF